MKNISISNQRTLNVSGSFMSLIVAAVCFGQSAFAAQAPVPLGSAAGFGVLAGTTVTTVPATTINGDVGVFTGNTVTGEPIINGTLHLADPTAAEGQTDLTIAYNDAAGRNVAPVTSAGNLGGMVLPPGLYKSATSLEISSGNLTLDGLGDPNAVWIFQMGTTLVTTAGRQVILIDGAKAENVFWQVGSSATIGAGSVFKGNILAYQSITMNTGATLDGRALARVGQVALDANTITVPGVAASVSAFGKTFLATITNGSGVLASTGKFDFVAATGTNRTYHLVPLTTNLLAQSGTYTYVKSGAANAELTFNGLTMALSFTNPTRGSFTSTTTDGSQSGTFVVGKTMPDVNNDGMGDIFFQRDDGALAAWKMKGTVFSGSVMLRNGTPAPDWRAFGQGDFNRDGKSDVAFQNKTTGALAVWLMDGTNVIRGAALASGRTPAWRAVSAADFNNDGQPDLLFQNGSGAAAVWIMNGTSLVRSMLLRNGAGLGSGWQITGTGDFNGDAQTDIAWRHSDGRAMLWNMTGMTFVKSVWLRTGPLESTGWHTRGVADFNFDGKPDLLWQNVNGATAFWFFNDTAYLGSASGRNAGTASQIIGPR